MAHPPRHTDTIFVDSMALRFISATRRALVRVTDVQPRAFVDTASGTIPVDAIGVAGINVQCRAGRWHYLELPDARSFLVRAGRSCTHAINASRHAAYMRLSNLDALTGSALPLQMSVCGLGKPPTK